MDECGIKRPTKAAIVLCKRARDACVPLPYITCVSVVFGGYFRVIPVHFKCMHYIHSNKERKARNLKVVSVTIKWFQASLVREESQQALAFIRCWHFSYKCLGFVVFGENKITKQM